VQAQLKAVRDPWHARSSIKARPAVFSAASAAVAPRFASPSMAVMRTTGSLMRVTCADRPVRNGVAEQIEADADVADAGGGEGGGLMGMAVDENGADAGW
jgi:hypothetical protein